MEKKWRVGDLQPMRGEGPMSQIGLVFYDETVSGLR